MKTTLMFVLFQNLLDHEEYDDKDTSYNDQVLMLSAIFLMVVHHTAL
jgi:hypothetical protein